MNKNKPNVYLEPIYTQWAQIGLMLIIYLFLPESPAWFVTRGNRERAKKSLITLNRGVKDYNPNHQVEALILSVEHEKAVAVEKSREHWYAIFRGTDGLRTVVSLWTNLTQQCLGLTLFSTFGTYFFQQTRLADLFLIKCITSSINIVTIIVVVFTVDRIGRRWIACCATTLMWVSCVIIGILGVVKQVDATTYFLVLFACLWSKRAQPLAIRTRCTDDASRRGYDSQRSSRLGLHRRNLLAAPAPIHSRLRRGVHLRRGSGDGPTDALHG